MKTTLFLIIACVALAGCGTSDTDMTTNSMNSAIQSNSMNTAGALAFTINVQVPIDVIFSNPCGGEDIQFVGTEHQQLHITINGNSANVRQRVNDQSVTGVGLTTGTKYNRTGMTKDNFTVHVGEQETFVNSFKVIGQGPDNNLLVQEVFHITINANGEVTVLFDKFTAVCK